jgi:hypothetical protein
MPETSLLLVETFEHIGAGVRSIAGRSFRVNAYTKTKVVFDCFECQGSSGGCSTELLHFAYKLTKRCASDSMEKLAASLAEKYFRFRCKGENYRRTITR